VLELITEVIGSVALVSCLPKTALDERFEQWVAEKKVAWRSKHPAKERPVPQRFEVDINP